MAFGNDARASALARRPPVAPPEEEAVLAEPAGPAGGGEAPLGDIAAMLSAMVETLPPEQADLVGQAAALLQQAAGGGAPQAPAEGLDTVGVEEETPLI